MIVRDRKKRRRSRAKPVIVPEALTVLAVRTVSAEVVDFEFSAPVSTNGAGSEGVVIQDTNLGTVAAVSSQQQNATTVRFTFEAGVEIEAGDAWVISDVPACLDLHGASLSVPQDGMVE